MKILENGFSVDLNSDLGIGLRQNFRLWEKEFADRGVDVRMAVRDGLVTIKPVPAYKSKEDSRVLYMRFCDLLARDGIWTAERLDMLEGYALKGVKGEATRDGISKVFSQFRQMLGVNDYGL